MENDRGAHDDRTTKPATSRPSRDPADGDDVLHPRPDRSRPAVAGGSPPHERPAGQQAILVGVDGSPGSSRALSWALDEAHRRGVPVEVVSVWEDPYRFFGEYVPIAVAERQEMSVFGRAAQALESARLQAAREAPEVRVVLSEVEGNPAGVLVARSAEAAMLVVGSRGLGGLTSFLVGSVSQQCVAHALCPVVVVGRPPLAADARAADRTAEIAGAPGEQPGRVGPPAVGSRAASAGGRTDATSEEPAGGE